MANVRTVYASSIAKLDSNVRTGGGTDDTAALQSLLDIARDGGGVHLIVDGAALVSGLTVYSNTTIECLSPDCGFYQIEQSNRAIVTNAHWDRHVIRDCNISLIGGTYNQNCLNQQHDIPFPEDFDRQGVFMRSHWVFAVEFYGVENLLMRDMTILDFRTFCVTIGNFRRVTIERVWLDLPNRMHAQNQDGFHFWGPGQFLTVRDCGGKVGDDFMNIGPDENDRVSSITDVLVDGIFHDDADQSVRILSRGTGLVDRVTIRNVQGTYRSFGFYINAWFPDQTMGNFGDIFIENVNLTHTKPNYEFRPAMLFSIGGDIRCLTLKNIRHEHPIDARAIAEIGLPFYDTFPNNIENYEFPAGRKPVLQNLVIDGLTVLENGQSDGMEQLQVFGEVGNMIVKNALCVKDAGNERSGNMLNIKPSGHIGNLVLDGILSVGLGQAVVGEERADAVIKNNFVEK
ncbi:MAG: hypothetical protein IIX15_03155 [Clostridia bacterium]|nr:hypothetical protein [Clostridia bacterium]